VIGDNRRGNPILFLKSFISICFDKSLTCFITNILQEQRGNLQISGRLSSLIDAVIAEQVNLTGYYFIFVIAEQVNLTGYYFIFVIAEQVNLTGYYFIFVIAEQIQIFLFPIKESFRAEQLTKNLIQ
jgi:hypothetical protein